MKTLNLLFILFFGFGVLFAQEDANSNMNRLWGAQHSGSNSVRHQRGKIFSDGNYAMFIHWGLYAQLANQWNDKTYYGIGEWIMHRNMAGIPIDEYKAVANSFNPVKFNAQSIVQLAKKAGMKYIIITSKHHDGFAMFHSKASKFNIVDSTPFGRDPMKELAAACREEGIGFGFYYSQNQDWTEAGGGGGPKVNEQGKKVTFEEYFYSKCLPQVREITTRYGDIVLVWFDTPGAIPKKHVEELIAEVRSNQPNALISGRVGHGMGDYQTFGDMEIPFSNIDGMWETVDVTNDSWGHAWYDQNWKSSKLILENLISTVARGGTYMLNVGPKADGTIPEEATYSLLKAGEWIKKYPQVVYAADPSPWKHRMPWGDITRKGNKLFLSIYHWPESGKLYLPGLKTSIQSATLLTDDGSQSLKFSKEDEWLILNTPYQKPNVLIPVIELHCDQEPLADSMQAIDPDYASEISTYFADTEGCDKKKKSWMEKFGEWKHITQIEKWKEYGKAIWDLNVYEPGYYMIKLNYTGTDRVVWRVTTDENEMIQNQQNASSVYTSYDIGWLKINTSGKHQIAVSLLEGDFDQTSLKYIEISRVK